MTHNLDSMPIGVQNEGGKVIWVIQSAQSRRSVVLTAGGQRSSVESEHRGSIGGTKTHMHASRLDDARLHGNREFHSERSRHRPIVTPTPLTEINNAYHSNRTQSCVIEPLTALKIGNAERNMIQHNFSCRYLWWVS